MEYCDLIADLLTKELTDCEAEHLPAVTPVRFFGVQTKLDLDPNGGFLVSTDKTITCRDNKGNSYKITVQANTQPKSMKDILDGLNDKHSNNGDPLNHYLDSITTKLAFAQQDRSVLAEITLAELEVLTSEIIAVREAQESSNGSF